MPAQKDIEKCNRCNNEVFDYFCANCGHPRKLKRINGQYILAEIGNVLNFNKGIFFTIREVLLRPGVSIQNFILKDRTRLVKPIVFIIVCSLVYTILLQFFHLEDGYVGYSFGEDSSATSIFDWVSKNYGYTNILMAVLIAFWVKVFFRKYSYNFFEILILLCFVMGVGMLLFSVFGIIDSLTNFEIMDKGFLIGVLYISWAIAQFFDKNKKVNYFKAFLSYLLGILSFSIIILIVGSLIDFMNK